MNKNIDQVELSRVIARQTGIDEKIVVAFIQEMFRNIEKTLVTRSTVEIEGLGVFRIIKSGASNRILFLGKSGVIKTESRSNIQTEQRGNKKQESIRASGEQVETDKSAQTIYNRQDNNLAGKSESVYGRQDVRSGYNETREKISSDNNISVRGRDTDIFVRNIDSEPNVQDETGYLPANTDLPLKIKLFLSRLKGKIKRTNKTILIAGLMVLAIILGIAGLIYFVKFTSSDKRGGTETVVTQINQSGSFREIVNNDEQHYSCVIVAQSDLSLKYLAEVFYGKELFWPYIYVANRNIVNSKLTIEVNSIIRIPKITVDLVGYTRGDMDADAVSLGNEIMKEMGMLSAE